MPSIELSMIVKNGASTLARCLESAHSAVDEIVIADTGSTDGSAQIARSYGARVIEVPWEDDFSKARNAALRHGRCDWVLFLDADELLDTEEAKGIASLLADPAVLGYDVRIWICVHPEHEDAEPAFPSQPSSHRGSASLSRLRRTCQRATVSPRSRNTF